MYSAKEINHRATSQPRNVNVGLKISATLGSYLPGMPEGNSDWSKWTPQGEFRHVVTTGGHIHEPTRAASDHGSSPSLGAHEIDRHPPAQSAKRSQKSAGKAVSPSSRGAEDDCGVIYDTAILTDRQAGSLFQIDPLRRL